MRPYLDQPSCQYNSLGSEILKAWSVVYALGSSGCLRIHRESPPEIMPISGCTVLTENRGYSSTVSHGLPPARWGRLEPLRSCGASLVLKGAWPTLAPNWAFLFPCGIASSKDSKIFSYLTPSGSLYRFSQVTPQS